MRQATQSCYNEASAARQTTINGILAQNILREFDSEKTQRTNLWLEEKKIILVDMDGVLADYEGLFYERWEERHPDKRIVLRDQRRHHSLDLDMPEYAQLIYDITNEEDFFHKLQPIEGALEGIRKLSRTQEVYICTKPSLHNVTCAHGKYMWVQEHLGSDWVKRTIIARDKTIIPGTYLIDDNPDIKGIQRPSWEHIIYDQPYNRHVTNKRRVTWKTIEDIL